MATQGNLELLMKALPFFAEPFQACTHCSTNFDQGALVRSFPAGTVVRQQGQPCEGLYVVRQGLAKVVIQKGGTEAAVDFLRRPGDAYGLGAIVDGKEYSASLVTVGPSEFVVLPTPYLDGGLEHHPEAYRDALIYLAQQLRQAHEWIVNLI